MPRNWRTGHGRPKNKQIGTVLLKFGHECCSMSAATASIMQETPPSFASTEQMYGSALL